MGVKRCGVAVFTSSLLFQSLYGLGCAGHTQTAVKREPAQAPAGVESEESGLIPAKIHAFVRQNTHITILVYELGDSAAVSPEPFHWSPVRRVTELDPARTTATLNALTSASTYSTSHIACVGARGTGIGLRLRGPNGNVDLIIDLLCKHVIDAEAHEEIGFLSRSGETFLKGIAADEQE